MKTIAKNKNYFIVAGAAAGVLSLYGSRANISRDTRKILNFGPLIAGGLCLFHPNNGVKLLSIPLVLGGLWLKVGESF